MIEAFERFDKRIKMWQHEPGADAKTRKFYTQDRKDMRAVLSACKKGDWSKAAKLAWRLDTILRDEIPHYLWSFMHENS